MQRPSKSPVDLLLIVCLIGLMCLLFLTHRYRQTSGIRRNVPKTDEPFMELEDIPINRQILPIGPLHSVAPVRKSLKKLLDCNDRVLERESLQYGGYWVVRNLIRGTVSATAGCADYITYTTIGDYTFFDNLAMLTKRWLGPISFAIFAPGDDMLETMDSIYYVRNCLPDSELIRQYVSFHVYFPSEHMASRIPHTEKEAIDWVPSYGSCAELFEPPYDNVDRNFMYKTIKNITYPINVGRNIARKAVNTYFILSSDIELIPSPQLAHKFLQMVEKKPQTIFDDKGGKTLRVFPLPVFELDDGSLVPSNKDELLELLSLGLAIPFHSKVCNSCHLVPKQKQWLKEPNTSHDRMTVFTVGKRVGDYRHWEPFYISDNREPHFDERVTWEGQSNKRIQNYAMCLLDYEYHVLHPSFLAHKPGIKRMNKKDPRYTYVPAMNKLIKNTIVPEYKILYGKNADCTT